MLCNNKKKSLFKWIQDLKYNQKLLYKYLSKYILKKNSKIKFISLFIFILVVNNNKL